MPSLKLVAQNLQGRWALTSRRDRRVLAVLGLGLAVAAEMLLVWPARTQRLLVQDAVTAEKQSTQDGHTARQAERARHLATLREELARVESDLTGLGALRSRAEPLTQLMQRSVSAQGLVLRSLRALPVEDAAIEAPPAAATAGTPNAAHEAHSAASAAVAHIATAIGGSVSPLTTGDAPAAALAAADGSSIRLYRHRVELRVAGPALALIKAMDPLATSLQPLRVEKVRVAAGEHGMAEATLTLATIRTERSWLEL